MKEETKTVNIMLPADAPIYSAKVRLTNEWNADTIFCSVFTHRFTQKPEYNGYVMGAIAYFPNTLTLEQLKEEVLKGRTFIGALFFDIDFYNKVYGGVTSLGILYQSSEKANLLWLSKNVSRFRSVEREEFLIEMRDGVSNDVRMLQDYFVLLSTFGLDVDHKHNEKGEDITPAYGEMYKEVRQRIIDYDLNTLFAYKTFSDPVKGERFRVIFKTDVPIFNWYLAHSVLLGLEQIFSEYFDPACKNVNRIYHGGTKLIEETHQLFGTPVELDKFFRIVAQNIKDKDKSNYSRNLENFARQTGLVIRNNAFAIRTVELSSEEVEELRQNEIDTYNKNFMKDYHFEVSADTHRDFFQEENLDEIIGTYYIYIRQYDDFVKNGKHRFYEICMSANKVKKPKKKKSKVDNIEVDEEEQQEEYNFEVYKQRGKIESIQLKDWQVVSDKCQLYRKFAEGKEEMQHDLLFKLSLSLMYFVGGTKRFLETITNFPAYEDELKKDWNGYIDYNKRAGYYPANCDNFCPYVGECTHIYNMRDTVAPRNRIYKIGEMEFVDITVIEQQLKEELKKFYTQKGFVLYEYGEE